MNPSTLAERVPAGIGNGIYSYREAAALIGVTAGKVQRWADGYTFKRKYDLGISSPILQTQRPVRGVLSFAELIELFFVEQYTGLGVKLKDVRLTAQVLAPELGPYPFAAAKLKTDGSYLFREVQGATILPATQQFVADFAQDFLRDVEFEKGLAHIYRPRIGNGLVVLDAGRSFGKPLTLNEGVPTEQLYDLFVIEQDIELVGDWFQVAPESVKAAIRFEASCRKAA